jgi:hypothetical protein
MLILEVKNKGKRSIFFVQFDFLMTQNGDGTTYQSHTSVKEN